MDPDAKPSGEASDKQEVNKNDSKVTIILKPTGSAPIMTKKKWMVDQDKPISWVMAFFHKYLQLGVDEKLFLYVNQTFAPSSDQIVRNLYDCYGANGSLTLNYCKTQAWG